MNAPDKSAKAERKGQPAQLGKAIRHRRKSLGKTLVEIAKEADLTTGFISQVERGISSPSLSSLMAIAAALKTTIEQLLSMPQDFSAYVPKDRRQTYSLGTSGRIYEKLGPGFAGALLYPAIIHRPPGHIAERMCHEGEAFCYLISGQLEYHLDGEVHVMAAGETIHHNTDRPHFSKVLGDGESVELWVTTTPIKTAPT